MGNCGDPRASGIAVVLALAPAKDWLSKSLLGELEENKAGI